MPRALESIRSAQIILTLCAASACAAEGQAGAPAPGAPRVLAAEVAATASAAPFGCAGSKIALRTKSGFYVGAFVGGGFGMIAMARSVGEPETFRSIDLGDSRVALQASSGHYVEAENGGGGSVYANQRRLEAATPFLLRTHWDDASITLRTPSDFFLSALLGGGTVMNTNTRAAGDWEALQVTCLEGKLDDPDQPGDSEWPDQPTDPAWPGDSSDPEWPEEPRQPGDPEWSGKPGLGG